MGLFSWLFGSAKKEIEKNNFDIEDDSFNYSSQSVYIPKDFYIGIWSTPTVYALSVYYFLNEDEIIPYMDDIRKEADEMKLSNPSFDLYHTFEYVELSLDYVQNESTRQYKPFIKGSSESEIEIRKTAHRQKINNFLKGKEYSEIYKNLLKEATQLKSEKQLDAAISKTKEALSFFDEKQLSKFNDFYYTDDAIIKLAKYLKAGKRFDEAWQVVVKKEEELFDMFFNSSWLKSEKTTLGFLDILSRLIKLRKESVAILKAEKRVSDYLLNLTHLMQLELLSFTLEGKNEKILDYMGKFKTSDSVLYKFIKNDEVVAFYIEQLSTYYETELRGFLKEIGDAEHDRNLNYERCLKVLSLLSVHEFHNSKIAEFVANKTK